MSTMCTPVKFYYHLLSPPSRALYTFFKLAKVPVEATPVDLLNGITV